MMEATATRFPCSKCDFKSKNKHYLAKHIKSIHEGIKFECEVMGCNYTANTRPSILKHLKSKHEGVTYPCDQCNHKANQKWNLQKHIQRKHHKEAKHKKFQCEVVGCKYEANTTEGIFRHIRSAHEGVNHPCDQCNYIATLKGNLNRHMKRKHVF